MSPVNLLIPVTDTHFLLIDLFAALFILAWLTAAIGVWALIGWVGSKIAFEPHPLTAEPDDDLALLADVTNERHCPNCRWFGIDRQPVFQPCPEHDRWSDLARWERELLVRDWKGAP